MNRASPPFGDNPTRWFFAIIIGLATVAVLWALYP
jgi:hypothetical protein